MTEPTNPETYRFWSEEKVRFADLDPLGHVNNNARGVYLECARVALFAEAGSAVTGDGESGLGVVLARLAIDFRGEARHPGLLRVGLRLGRVGRTSIALAEAVFDGARCVASAESVCVLMDVRARRPAQVPDAVRARLEALAG